MDKPCQGTARVYNSAVVLVLLSLYLTDATDVIAEVPCGGGRLTRSPTEHGRVVGGHAAAPHSWPWQVSLQRTRGRNYCGGSIINRNWIITAAHCNIYRGDRVVALVGLHILNRTDRYHQEHEIEQSVRHPNYRQGRRYNNDIRLLQLRQPLTFTDAVLSVCLPDQGKGLPTNVTCYATGWGRLSE